MDVEAGMLVLVDSWGSLTLLKYVLQKQATGSCLFVTHVSLHTNYPNLHSSVKNLSYRDYSILV